MTKFLCSTALLALVTSPALASEGYDDETIVVTATGADLALDKTGQAITVVESDTIQLRQNAVLSDLLATTPGVTVSRNGGIGTTTTVRIRGAEGDQTLTLIDGVRVNDPSSPGGGFDFGNLLTGNIERVEILRGPNSVPWGSQAIGGVVNIVTARPTETLKANVRAEYGYKDSAQIVGNVSGTAGKLFASLGGGYFRDDGISAAASGSERDGYRNYGVNGRVELAMTDNITLDLRGYFSKGKLDLDGFPAPTYSFADTTEYSKAQQLTGYAGIRAVFADGSFRNNLALTVSDINRDNYEPAFGPAPSFLARGRSERIAYQGDWTISTIVRTVFGAEHERSRFTDGFSPAKTSVSSLYGQLIVDPVESLTLTGGARLDDHKTYGSKATLSANLAWRPATGTVIRASYGEGFKAPTLYQLYGFYGDVTLKPETARSYDIGFEQSLLDGAFTFGATAFARKTRNQIDFDLVAFRYNNIALSRAKGVETFISLKPADNFSVSANYTYTDAEGRQVSALNYAPLLRRPKHSLSLSADWTAWEKAKLGATMRMVSDSRDGFGGFTRLDGFALVDLRAAVPLGDRLEIYGRVENLFDAQYQTVSGYSTYGRNAHIGVRASF